MKNGKNPTKKQKMLIKSNNLNPESWLIYKKVDGELHLVHRYTSATHVILNS